MPVEIREIVLQARVVEDGADGMGADSNGPGLHQQLEELRHEMKAECDRMIRDALDRRLAR